MLRHSVACKISHQLHVDERSRILADIAPFIGGLVRLVVFRLGEPKECCPDLLGTSVRPVNQYVYLDRNLDTVQNQFRLALGGGGIIIAS